MSNQPRNESNEFLREAEAGRTGLIAEFIDFLKHNKKWWLIPILLCFLGAIALVIFMLAGGGAAAPFIYPLV